MNREIRDEWVKRLRSGDYEQGTGHLRADGKYCCLGVLAEIAVELNVAKSGNHEGTYYYDGDQAGLSGNIMRWCDISNGLGVYEGGALFTDNDTGVPFIEIANIIEREF